MTPSGDPVAATRLLLEHRIKALPVVVRSTLAEIMTRQDILDQIVAHGGSINPRER